MFSRRGSRQEVGTNTISIERAEDRIGPGPTSAQPTPAISISPSATGEAARAQLKQSGQYHSLESAFQAARYAAEKIDPSGPHSRGAEFFAANPRQQLRAWFSREGIELASGYRSEDEKAEPWSVQLRLRATGRKDALTPISQRTVRAEGSRVEMSDQAGAIIEWFENKHEGIEQGFTIANRPSGDGELELVMGVNGSMRTLNDGVRFMDAHGADVVSATGLKAWDANGRALNARMEVRGAELALLVADEGADYPVTIDPLFANVEARLVESPPENDGFGTSLAMDGTTALVGAPTADTPAGADCGRVYVFRDRSDLEFGWRRDAELLASDSPLGFGFSVALSGNTALVGAFNIETIEDPLTAIPYPRVSPNSGKAYVFINDGQAWSEQATLAPVDGAPDQGIGAAVALDGDTALVGGDTGRTFLSAAVAPGASKPDWIPLMRSISHRVTVVWVRSRCRAIQQSWVRKFSSARERLGIWRTNCPQVQMGRPSWP